MKAKHNTLIALGLVLLAGNTTAGDFQSHRSIHEAVRMYMLEYIQSSYDQEPKIIPGKLDSRLKLRQCILPLETELPDGARAVGKITVNVKCGDYKPWSLHVPVTVSLMKDVLVAKESLPRGTLLSREHLKQVSYDLARLPHGYVSDISKGLGMKLKRPVTAGTALTPGMLEKPRIINRGQRVIILARSGGMEVRTSGKALAHGAAGERIGVMNIKSKQKLEGVVTTRGEINVGL